MRCDADHRGRPGAQPAHRLARDDAHEHDGQERHYRHREKGMGEMSMEVQVIEGAACRTRNIDVRRVRCEQQDWGGEGTPALQSDAGEEEAGCGMGEVVHLGCGPHHCKCERDPCAPRAQIQRYAVRRSRERRAMGTAAVRARTFSLRMTPPKYSSSGYSGKGCISA